MPNALCVKKINCDEASMAAVRASDRVVFEQIVPAIESGQLSDGDGAKLIQLMVDNETKFLDRYHVIMDEVMSRIGGPSPQLANK